MDTYFLHNNGIESLSMYAGPSIIDTEQNGMSYICKCLSPYAGHNCEGKMKLINYNAFFSGHAGLVENKVGSISISKESKLEG